MTKHDRRLGLTFPTLGIPIEIVDSVEITTLKFSSRGASATNTAQCCLLPSAGPRDVFVGLRQTPVNRNKGRILCSISMCITMSISYSFLAVLLRVLFYRGYCKRIVRGLGTPPFIFLIVLESCSTSFNRNQTLPDSHENIPCKDPTRDAISAWLLQNEFY